MEEYVLSCELIEGHSRFSLRTSAYIYRSTYDEFRNCTGKEYSLFIAGELIKQYSLNTKDIDLAKELNLMFIDNIRNISNEAQMNALRNVYKKIEFNVDEAKAFVNKISNDARRKLKISAYEGSEDAFFFVERNKQIIFSCLKGEKRKSLAIKHKLSLYQIRKIYRRWIDKLDRYIRLEKLLSYGKEKNKIGLRLFEEFYS